MDRACNIVVAVPTAVMVEREDNTHRVVVASLSTDAVEEYLSLGMNNPGTGAVASVVVVVVAERLVAAVVGGYTVAV